MNRAAIHPGCGLQAEFMTKRGQQSLCQSDEHCVSKGCEGRFLSVLSFRGGRVTGSVSLFGAVDIAYALSIARSASSDCCGGEDGRAARGGQHALKETLRRPNTIYSTAGR